MPAQEPVRVALGVLAGVTGGPATYGRRLAAALAARDDAAVTVLTDEPRRFEGVDTVALPMRGGIDRLRWQYLSLPRALRRTRCDVYHDTKNALPPRPPVPAVVTVHDLAHVRVPQTFPRLSRWFLAAATRHAVARAARVIVPSEATAADLRQCFPAAADKVRVVPHGIDPAPEPAPAEVEATLTRLGVPRPYVLHVGTVQARKNVDLLVQAVRALRAEGLPHRVVVAGRRGWLAGAALEEIARDDAARHLGEVAARDLPALYRGADAFCSPSAYEGFGFAVADALAAGVPVAVTDRSSLPELCGGGCVRIPELTAPAIAEALRPLLGDASLRQRLAAAGRARAAELTWERAAEGHVAVYREVAQRVGRRAATA